jgi:hypothetical protein
MSLTTINHCLINRMGLEKWAASKAAGVGTTCFSKPRSFAEYAVAQDKSDKKAF